MPSLYDLDHVTDTRDASRGVSKSLFSGAPLEGVPFCFQSWDMYAGWMTLNQGLWNNLAFCVHITDLVSSKFLLWHSYSDSISPSTSRFTEVFTASSRPRILRSILSEGALHTHTNSWLIAVLDPKEWISSWFSTCITACLAVSLLYFAFHVIDFKSDISIVLCPSNLALRTTSFPKKVVQLLITSFLHLPETWWYRAGFEV